MVPCIQLEHFVDIEIFARYLFTVDTSYLNSCGVIYANTPNAVSDPTAVTTVQLIFQTVRAASQAEAVVRRGEWRRGLNSTPDIRDLTIGIIGMGSIGKVRELCMI
jgi:glyoxylate reductase